MAAEAHVNITGGTGTFTGDTTAFTGDTTSFTGDAGQWNEGEAAIATGGQVITVTLVNAQWVAP